MLMRRLRRGFIEVHEATSDFPMEIRAMSCDGGSDDIENSSFRGFIKDVLQVAAFSLCWVFFQHIAAYFQARVVAKGGDIRGVPTSPATASVGQPTQTRPPGFWSAQPTQTSTGQRDFSEFR